MDVRWDRVQKLWCAGTDVQQLGTRRCCSLLDMGYQVGHCDCRCVDKLVQLSACGQRGVPGLKGAVQSAH